MNNPINRVMQIALASEPTTVETDGIIPISCERDPKEACIRILERGTGKVLRNLCSIHLKCPFNHENLKEAFVIRKTEGIVALEALLCNTFGGICKECRFGTVLRQDQ